MNFITGISVEFKKLKRSKLFLILLIPMLLVWGMAIINADMNFEMAKEGLSPKDNFYIQSYLSYVWFMLPASLIVVTVLLTRLEHKNRGFLRMASLPLSTAKLCICKYIVLLTILFVEVCMMFVGYLISAFIVSKIWKYHFFLNIWDVTVYTVILFLLSIPMATVYWFLSIAIPSPIAAIGIGLGSVVPTLIFANVSIWSLYPMCYPMMFIIGQQHKFAAHLTPIDIHWSSAFPVMLLLHFMFLILSVKSFGKHIV